MNFLDKAVAYVSPERALKRQAARKILSARTKRDIGRSNFSGYAANTTDRMTGAWSPGRVNVNDLISDATIPVKNRIQQLVRDFPYFARAANSVCDYVVGDGIAYQARIKRPDGTIDEKKSQQIEDARKWWSDEADASGNLDLSEIDRLLKRQDFESGNFLIVEKRERDRNRYLPFSLQVLETDWLTDINVTQSGKNTEIKRGIEYDINTGRKMAYHFTDPDGWGKVSTVPASEVIHGYETLRPGQQLGISPMTAAVLLAHDFSDFMSSTLDTAKLRSKYLAIVTTPDPYSRQFGLDQDEDNNKLEELENAVLEYLRPGEEIKFPQGSIPAVELDPFVKLLLRMLAVTSSIPYEIISGDYSGTNFSTIQMSRTDFNFQLEPIIKRHIRQANTRIHRRFIHWLYYSGKVDMPGYLQNPYRYYDCEWQPPRSEASTLRDAKSRATEIGQGTRSPIEIIKGRGREPVKVLEEIAAFQKMADGMGVVLNNEAQSLALANNPKAVEEQTKKKTLEVVK